MGAKSGCKASVPAGKQAACSRHEAADSRRQACRPPTCADGAAKVGVGEAKLLALLGGGVEGGVCALHPGAEPAGTQQQQKAAKA